MSRSVTIRLNDDVYNRFHEVAVGEHRSVSNLIETFALNKLEEELFTNTFETSEIASNKRLLARLKKGHQDAVNKKGHLIG